MLVKVKGPSMDLVEFNYDEPVKAETILKLVEDKMPYPIYYCKVDNAYRGLPHYITHDCTLEFLDIRTSAAWLVYQDSLVMLYIKAVHDILGKDVLVTINNSLNKGLFTNIKAKYTEEVIAKIQQRMRELVDLDVAIVKKHYSRSQAIELATSLKLRETIDLLSSVPSLDDVEIYSLEDETEIFYHPLVPSTGYLKYFELRTYKNGVLLRFPHQSNPLVIPEYENQHLLYDAFKQANQWGQLMNCNFVNELNEKVTNMDTENLYLLQEALHEKKISSIADEIHLQKKRIVLICGPSSSGKTTFAKRLCIQLQVTGLKTLYLGTDDYFVDREFTPIDENGEKDYENIECVDTRLFVSNLQDLLAGKETDIPIYDFKEGRKVFGTRVTKMEKNEVIVIEGIHALNKILTDGIDEDEKYKIYISPFTPIGIDHHNRIPTTDCRMLRRMVRDNQFRNIGAAETIKLWSKVRKGEDKNIFPFNGEADVFFNSNCIYELAVLKKYAEPLLAAIRSDEPEYGEAQRMLSFLRFFISAKDDDKILNNSIMREFIGGSIIV